MSGTPATFPALGAYRASTPQRILHVSNFGFKPTKVYLHGVAHKLTNGWVRGGHHVVNFSDRDIARWEGILGHRKLGVRACNKALLAQCRALQPDVLVLGHADIITPDTVAQIRSEFSRLKVMQWNVDPIFVGDGASGLTLT
jgi:hypothetical protein